MTYFKSFDIILNRVVICYEGSRKGINLYLLVISGLFYNDDWSKGSWYI